MRRATLAASLILVAVLFPAQALASAPSTTHARVYLRTYHRVVHRFGKRAPGRNIIRDGLSRGALTDRAVTHSLVILRRMLAASPPVAVRPTPTAVRYTRRGLDADDALGIRDADDLPVARKIVPRPAPVPSPVSAPVAAPAPPGGLVACIVSHESGGNSQVVNYSGHMGLGQWDEATWLADGGGRYAHTPLGASYAEQLTIIEEQVAAGHTTQWTLYDGC